MGAKQATQTIPIDFQAVADPEGSGLAASLARRAGDVTGTSGVSGSLVLELAQSLLLRADEVIQ